MGLGRRPALDGIRGIAVLGVLATHTGLLDGGFLGVDLFFVLSGFLITTLLVDEHAATGRISFAGFYRRRVLRLLPALVLLLAFATVYALTVAPPTQAAVTMRGVGSSLLYVANLQVAAHGTNALGFLGHTWSLSVEEQFYIVWPLLLLCLLATLGRRGALAAALAAIVALTALRTALWLHGADPDVLFVGSLTHGDTLLIGCALALARAEGLRAPLSPRLLGLLGAAGVVALALTVPSHAAMLPWAYTAVGLAAAALIGWALQLRRGPLCQGPLHRLGGYSYAMYLWYPVAIAAADALWRFDAWRPVACFLIAVAVDVAIAAASHRYVEQPFLRLRRRPQPAAA